jgi:hypothetical protein
MSLASTVLRTATSVCSAAASAVTVTVSVIAPGSRAKSMRRLAPASSWTFWRVNFLKPSSSAEIS